MKNSKECLVESVSCLMDGQYAECDRLVAHLKEDEHLRHQWQRFHWIGAALRDELPLRISPNFPSRVMSVLQNEPTVIAPRFGRAPLVLVKPLVGAAVAATVAAVTLIATQTWQSPVSHGEQGATHLAAVDNVLQAQPVARGSSGQAQLRGSAPAHWEGSQAELQELLNDYLRTHTEQSISGQMHGIVPYVRVVGLDAEHQ